MIKSLLTDKQKEYIKCRPRRINLLHGSVRSGKTWISLVQWALFVLSRSENEEFLMIGKTLTTLKRNCLRLLADLVGSDNFVYYTSTKMAVLYGRTIWLEGADNERAESKIRGMTLSGAYMDEMTLIPNGFSKMLLSRLSVKDAKLFATTNPDVPSNYVYTDFIQNQDIDIRTELFNIDDNTFLDPEYVKQLKREYTGVFFQRYILGLWVRAEGVIFRQFADNPEGWLIDDNLDHDTIKQIAYITFGVDFGESTSHTVFVATGIYRRGAGIIALDERKLNSKGISPDKIEREFIDFVQQVRKEFPDIRLGYAFCDHPETIINGLNVALRKANIPISAVMAAKEKINTRIYAQEKMLNIGLLKIRRKCTKLVYSLQNQTWDEKHTDQRLDENPDINDIADAFEYSWEAWIDEIGVRL